MKHDLNTFDEHYRYKDHVLVNEIYEDEDHRSNWWSWGKINGNYVEDPQTLTSVRSNSYSTFEEIWDAFVKEVDNVGV
jgi:hypothetical protein